MERQPAWADRFWSKVNATGDCWEWQGTLTSDGYGHFRLRLAERGAYTGPAHGLLLAHRTVWELLVGPIATDHTVDHLCRVRHCVNPDHLDVVTMQENILRGESPTARNARKAHCKHGHALTGRNLVVLTNGWRRCRTCTVRRTREWRQRQ